MAKAFREHGKQMIHFHLSQKICNMLKSTSPMFKPDHNLENMGQETYSQNK